VVENQVAGAVESKGAAVERQLDDLAASAGSTDTELGVLRTRSSRDSLAFSSADSIRAPCR
jgi:hypothetical protein